MGGRSSGAIVGIPVAKPAAERIFPVLSVDKEIWLPKDAAIDASSGRLQLEITFETVHVEILDQPAQHPWIEAAMQYAPSGYRPENLKQYRSRCDAGQYAMIHANVEVARIINADTGAKVLKLELK